MHIIQSFYRWVRRLAEFIRTHKKPIKIITAIVLIIGIPLIYKWADKRDKSSLIQLPAGEYDENVLTFTDADKDALKAKDPGKVPKREAEESKANNLSHDSSGSDDSSGLPEKDEKIYCDISGAVKNPGLYKVLPTDRLENLIERAGGLEDYADIDVINRARILSDGEKVYIPSKEENLPPLQTEVSQGSRSEHGDGNFPLDINHADSDMLQEVPGIGPVTADRIIEYRKNNGLFSSIEEIKNVSGIGEKTFEKIKKFLKV
jgi:competence protein ComEA